MPEEQPKMQSGMGSRHDGQACQTCKDSAKLSKDVASKLSELITRVENNELSDQQSREKTAQAFNELGQCLLKASEQWTALGTVVENIYKRADKSEEDRRIDQERTDRTTSMLERELRILQATTKQHTKIIRRASFWAASILAVLLYASHTEIVTLVTKIISGLVKKD